LGGTPNATYTSPGGVGSTAGSGGATSGGFLQDLKTELLKPGTLISGAGGIASLLMNNSVPGLGNLQSQAATLSGVGGPLAQSLATGNLPAGAAAANAAATEAAKAQVRSTYANMGLSGSSQEAGALAGVDEKAAAQQYQELLSATTTGLTAEGQASGLYEQIMNAQVAQQQRTQQALARLSAALAGGTGNAAATAAA
jgi:hypothetical protein